VRLQVTRSTVQCANYWNQGLAHSTRAVFTATVHRKPCHHYSCSVTFGSLPAPQLLQGSHHCRRDRYLPGLWSGTTLRWTFVPVPCPPKTTDNSRPMERSRCGGRFSQARRQLTKRGELWATTTTTTTTTTTVLLLLLIYCYHYY